MIRTIGSREYKLILNSERFCDRKLGAAALQDLVCRIAEAAGAETNRQDNEKLRRTHYLDTGEFHLRRSSFILRVRFEEEDAEFKVSLKYRSPDRYLAASKDVRLSEGPDNAKFEEDILPPFRSVFSQSNSRRFGEQPEIGRVKDLVDRFPGLQALDLAGDMKLERVNRFQAVEVFVKLCKLSFDDGPTIKCGLSFWYHSAGDTWPLISELAYDYKTDSGDDFPLPTVEGANRLYASLLRQPGWFNPNETTKTRFAYETMAPR